jgi:hypothetical protein
MSAPDDDSSTRSESESPTDAQPELKPEMPLEIAAPFDPIGTARRRHGLAGAIVAGGMFGIDQALTGRKIKQEAPIVMAASDEPVDIDHHGITVPVDADRSVVVAPQPRSEPLRSPRRAKFGRGSSKRTR